jgi:membrane-associated phospholipid phosphatase
MLKYVAVAVWPVGLAVILCAGGLLAWRAARADDGAARWSPPRFLSGGGERGMDSQRASLIQYVLLLIGACIVLYAVMALVGLAAVHGGPTIDKPIWNWTVHHRVHKWTSIMENATQVGYKWTTWGAAMTGGVLLSFIWRRNRWIPFVSLVTLVLTEHFLTIALNVTFHRPGPPGSHGTFPSGGTDRAFAIYGLIAYMLWREVSRRRTGTIISATIVAALGFNEAYSRLYLAVHWFTDVLSGIIWGCLLAAAFILIVRLVAGPVGDPDDAAIPVRAPDQGRRRREVPA